MTGKYNIKLRINRSLHY